MQPGAIIWNIVISRPLWTGNYLGPSLSYAIGTLFCVCFEMESHSMAQARHKPLGLNESPASASSVLIVVLKWFFSPRKEECKFVDITQGNPTPWRTILSLHCPLSWPWASLSGVCHQSQLPSVAGESKAGVTPDFKAASCYVLGFIIWERTILPSMLAGMAFFCWEDFEM